MLTINLKCRPELIQQWQQDVERDPNAFARMLTPSMVVALVHDAVAASHLNALLARLGAPGPVDLDTLKDFAQARLHRSGDSGAKVLRAPTPSIDNTCEAEG